MSQVLICGERVVSSALPSLTNWTCQEPYLHPPLPGQLDHAYLPLPAGAHCEQVYPGDPLSRLWLVTPDQAPAPMFTHEPTQEAAAASVRRTVDDLLADPARAPQRAYREMQREMLAAQMLTEVKAGFMGMAPRGWVRVPSWWRFDLRFRSWRVARREHLALWIAPWLRPAEDES